MKLRDIIKLSSIMLNLEDILNSEKLYDETFVIENEQEVIKGNDDVEKEINLLIRCFNLVYNEIATDYFPLIKMEEIEVSKGFFNLNRLENRFYKFVKLEDKNSVSINCKIYDNILYAKDGKFKLIYGYIPNKVGLNDEIINFNGKLDERIFALGLNKEYCFIGGLYEEAKSYKTKFEEGLKSISAIKKNITMPKRRWI